MSQKRPNSVPGSTWLGSLRLPLAPALTAAAILLISNLGCERQSAHSGADKDSIKSAQFGVFYGSQIRQREEVPFELDPSKQLLGFRIEFETPLKRPSEIQWELSKPGKRDRKNPALAKPEGRVTKLAFQTAPAGALRFEQAIAMEPGDPLGVWNLRVTKGPDVLIDRPFLVFDSAARRRARAKARVHDGGVK